jgi:hypothetical protein
LLLKLGHKCIMHLNFLDFSSCSTLEYTHLVHATCICLCICLHSLYMQHVVCMLTCKLGSWQRWRMAAWIEWWDSHSSVAAASFNLPLKGKCISLLALAYQGKDTNCV